MRVIPAQEFACLVYGSHRASSLTMVCIRAAFDSSKEHPCGITAVAGYMASADEWQLIEEPWNIQLKLRGLNRFRLSEVRHRFGNDWIDVARPFASLLGKLRNVGSILNDADWSQLDHDSEYLRLCPHREHACLDNLFGVLSHSAKNGFGEEQLAVVFDNDWGNRDAIIRIHDAWCQRTSHPGFHLFMKGAQPWDSLPLQAADLLAGLYRLDPFHKSILADKIEHYGSNPISELANLASPNGSVALWSIALADKIDDAKRRESERLAETGQNPL